MSVYANVPDSDSSRSASPDAEVKDVETLLREPPMGLFEQKRTVIDNTGDGKPRIKKNWRPPSTWFFKPREKQTFLQKLASRDVVPESVRETVTEAEYIARGPVPHEPLRTQHLLILSHAVRPLMLQTISWLLGYTWSPTLTWFVYFVSMQMFAFPMIRYLNSLQAKYGVFDQVNKPRDLAPDQHVHRLAIGVILFMIVRPMLPIILAYDRNASPLAGLDWFTPIRMVVYTIVLDLAFYGYHRTTHVVDRLWWVHRLHHGTKHPSVLLSILAGDVQELIEILLCPLIASMFMEMSFAELQISAYYQLFTEAMGHSGARADLTNPINSVFLKPFGLDIVVEDHDLHHRYGRSGRNFGKQSRVWDKLFGTCDERIETGKPFPPPQ